jgi:hypothetical protein
VVLAFLDDLASGTYVVDALTPAELSKLAMPTLFGSSVDMSYLLRPVA